MLLNAGGAVAVSGLALYYIDRMSQRFTKTVDEYMTQKLVVDKELSAQIQKFASTNTELRQANQEFREVINKLYVKLAENNGIKFKNKRR